MAKRDQTLPMLTWEEVLFIVASITLAWVYFGDRIRGWFRFDRAPSNAISDGSLQQQSEHQPDVQRAASRMRGRDLLVEANATLLGHPETVLLELLKLDSRVISEVKLALRVRGANWWSDEFYTFPTIKQGNSAAAEDMAQGLYKQGRLPPDSMDKLLQHIDDARRATSTTRSLQD